MLSEVVVAFGCVPAPGGVRCQRCADPPIGSGSATSCSNCGHPVERCLPFVADCAGPCPTTSTAAVGPEPAPVLRWPGKRSIRTIALPREALDSPPCHLHPSGCDRLGRHGMGLRRSITCVNGLSSAGGWHRHTALSLGHRGGGHISRAPRSAGGSF